MTSKDDSPFSINISSEINAQNESLLMQELNSSKNNEKNLYKPDADGFYPLHKVALTFSPEDLKKFLVEKNYDRYRINVSKERKNSLHLVIQKISHENYEKAKKCIEILIEHGCSVNMPNKDTKTPFYLLLKEVQEKLSIGHELIEWIVTKVPVDFYTYRSNEMKELFQRNNPNLKLPERDSNVLELSCGFMEILIRKKQENDFIAKFDNFVDSAVDYHDDDEYLILAEFLYIAVEKSCEEIIKFLINYGADIDAKLSHHYSILQLACLQGYPKILEILLKSNPKIENSRGKKNVLHIMCEQFHMETCADPKRSYKKCFEMIIDHCDQEVINQKDEKGQTPLFYVARYKYDDAVVELLKKGAYINAESKFNETPLDYLKHETLKKFLDECIKDEEGITIDYNFLMCRRINVKSEDEDLAYGPEIPALENITKHHDLRPLIAHPVLASFLHMKWSKLSLSFHFNLAMYSLYFALLIPYIVILNVETIEHESTIFKLLQVFLFLCTLSIALRELIQMTIGGLNYFLDITNLFEIILIILSAMLTLGKLFISENFWSTVLLPMSVVNILLASMEFLLLIGTLPYLNVSTYMVTFVKVAMSFFKSLILCSIMIISFGLCFFLIFREDVESNQEGAPKNESCEDSNRFGSVRISMVSMIAMLTGELEVSSLALDKRNEWVSIFFLLFVFLMTIVLFNWIQALAFDDTQKIRMEGEIIDLCEKIKVLANYEEIAFSVTGHVLRMRKRISLFPYVIPHGMILIKHDEKNAIYPYDPLKKDEIKDQEKVTCLKNVFKRKMDKSIMKKVHEILEKRKDNEANPERLCIIEKDIKDVQAKLERITNILEKSLVR